MSKKIIVDNEAMTINLGQRLGKLLFGGALIVLEGELGAGKTTFTKGIALGLDITKTVNSPTFTIIKEYQGRLNLYHMDLYRILNSLEDLGFDEYFYGDGVSVLEWADNIKEQLPENYLKIKITVIDEEKRSFTLLPKGKRYEEICEVLFNETLN